MKKLEERWSLDEDDKDMIVMYHRFGFTENGVDKVWESHMVTLGTDAQETAMGKTMGLPVEWPPDSSQRSDQNAWGVHTN